MADFSGNYSIQFAIGTKGAALAAPFTATDNEDLAGFGDAQANNFEAGDLIDFVISGATPILATDSYVGFIVVEGYTLFVTESTTTPGNFFLSGLVDPADQVNVLNALPTNYGDLTVTQSPFLVCFTGGTLIATGDGETPVDRLAIGDLVRTEDDRLVPVRWIGRLTVMRLFTGHRARPVRVTAGALGQGVPHTDLVLTADHALILDGLAVNAGALVNGTTIMLDPAPDRATYYHVETEDHDIILANGAPAETYVPYVGRRAFDNFAEYDALYGPERTIQEMPLPRVASARLLSEARPRRRLLRRA